ncbi:MAG: aminotransferase class I/II-fold pyridoxal phosphate-dependent enzyme [Planctomycetia bacterium]|nr:aminotransferase class I/II-fold pyridoxal phosphate-dependent enzyme [Planctomycetia bacterium]
MTIPILRASEHLHDVRYEIRGALARRAEQLERAGHEIVKLNIGNPGAFGFRMPESMRVAIVQNLHQADPYSHQKGIFAAREAVVMQQQDRGVMDVSADDVFIGNGVSELIMLAMRALLNPGDEVLVPSPDYPLWTASVVIHGARAVHYPCRPERGFVPDPAEVESLVSDRTRAIVVINPNNPAGAVYPRAALEALAGIAERRNLVLCADEIYDEMLQSILDLTRPGGRLHATRAAVLEAVGRSRWLSVVTPRGAMYAFIRVHAERLPGGVAGFDDQAFALDLLERKHVLVAPGSSFNVPYRDHFRVTLLPDAEQTADVFARIESLLDEYAAADTAHP